MGGFMDQSFLDRDSSRLSPLRISSSRWALFALMGTLVLLTSTLALFRGIETTQFSVDEPGWISSGLYYTALYEKGDFDWNKWYCENCDAFGHLNLHMGEYLYGIPLKIEEPQRVATFFGYYDFQRSYQANVHAGLVPPPGLLIRAREISAFFGVLCCVAVFAVGFWAFNPWVGAASAALLMSDAVLHRSSTQAMTDTFYNFFLLTICLASIAIVKALSRKKMFALVCLTGILTACACSVKITGILLGSGLFLGTLAWLFWRQTILRKETAWLIGAFSLFCIGSVYLLNPLFWPSWNQLHVKQAWVESRSLSHDVFAGTITPWRRADIEKIETTYPQLKNLSHPLEFPILFGRWSHEMHRQEHMGLGNWQGNRLIELHENLFMLAVPVADVTNGFDGTSVVDARPHRNSAMVKCVAFLIAIFTVAGLWSLAKSSRLRGAHAVVLLAFVLNYLLIVALMHLNYNRYYLPTLILLQLIAAFGFHETIQGVIRVARVRQS
jgi:hypothetical protein